MLLTDNHDYFLYQAESRKTIHKTSILQEIFMLLHYYDQYRKIKKMVKRIGVENNYQHTINLFLNELNVVFDFTYCQFHWISY